VPAGRAHAPDRPAGGRARDWIAGGAIAAAGLAAYLPTARAGFVFDDHVLLGEGAPVRGPLWRLWVGTATPDWWPLTWTALWAQLRLWGEAPLGYHAVNVLLHVAAALLLWRALRALAVPGAWLAGLLFVLHPVAVESVAWVSELKNVLSGALFLGSLLAWIRFDGGGARRLALLAWSLFLLALLAKASTVMLPVVLLGIPLWRRGRLERRDWVRAAPFFALSLLLGAVTAWFQWNRAIAEPVVPRGAAERVGGAAWAFLSYLQKAFLPVGLGFVYEPWPVGPASPWFWAPLAVTGALFAGLWALRRTRARGALFAVSWHALMVLPVLGLVEIAYLHVGPVSNHLQYLALMGPVALVAAGLAVLGRAGGRLAAAGGAAAVAIAGWLGATTWSRSGTFADDLSLWRQAVTDAPRSAYAAWMYADRLTEADRGREALRELGAFAERAPEGPVRRRARALWLLKSGRVDEAVAEARRAEAERADPAFRVQLGQLLARGGRPAEAIELLAPVVRAWPRYAAARYWLAVALSRAGRPEEAIAELREGLALSPGDERLARALELALARRRDATPLSPP
jgi:hypothetical protein